MLQRSMVWLLAVLVGLGLVAYLDHRFSTALPMMHLYYLPIFLAAVSWGYVGGLVAAGSAIVLFEITHAVVRGEPLRFDEADVLRFALFLGTGFIAAKLVRDRQRLSGLTQALHRRNEELADANRRLEKLSQARADFVAVASHELKNALTPVLAYAQSQARESLEPERRVQLASKLYDAARRLQRTAENLLDATLLESGQLTMRQERVRLADLLEECGVSVVGEAARRLRILLPEALLNQTVLADRHRLLEVLANLVSNALKYSPEGSLVTISTEARPSRLLISVSDHGPGIPEEEFPRIFERYYRGPDGRVRADGTGLGLSVSREIVRAHGGELTVRSEPGCGSTFIVELPLSSCPTANSQAPLSSASAT